MTHKNEINERIKFASAGAVSPLPDLIEIQKNSYDWFINEGLADLFEEISPITDFIGRDLELYLEDYYLDEPKFDEVESRSKNITYEASLRVQARLVNKKTNQTLTQEVFLGDFPLMTKNGTFIVNGIERVVVSQLIRSAGVIFTSESKSTIEILVALAKKLGIGIRKISLEELEDIGLAEAMKEGRTNRFVETEKYLSKLKNK